MVEEYNPESSNELEEDGSVPKGRPSIEAYREYLEEKGLNPDRWYQDFEYLEKEKINTDSLEQDFDFLETEEPTA
jgi:hypothetical protein